MKRLLSIELLGALLLAPVLPGAADPTEGSTPGVVIGGSKYLQEGANAIRAGRYDDGIALTLYGLEHDLPSPRDRAAGLANLCAAHVAKGEPDKAIPYCNKSLELNDGNWKAYSNRSHAYFQKGMLAEAASDNAAAAAIAPNAAHVRMIRGLLNERRLKPRITMREHQQ